MSAIRQGRQPMECDLSTPVPEWIIEHPETTSVFNELELDVSCGGKSLEYVAFQKGLEPGKVLAELRSRMTRHSDR